MEIKPYFKEQDKLNLFNQLQNAKQPLFGCFNQNYLQLESSSQSFINREFTQKYSPENFSKFLVRHNYSKIIREEI